MKCRSLLPKDIDCHIKRMYEHFYMLNSVNNASLKRVFFVSFLEDLHPDMERLIQSRNYIFEDFSHGELSHVVKKALNILCEKHAAIEGYFKQRKSLRKACKTNLEIGCPKQGARDCKPSPPSKKKKNKFSSRRPFLKRSSKRYRKF
jgi:hypothetical protein